MREPKAILTEARALIEAGWCKRVYHTVVKDVDCYCSLGSINQVTHGYPNYPTFFTDEEKEAETAYYELAKAIRPEVGNARDAWHIIGMFNDSHTKDEVLAVFDKAIAA